MGIFDTNYDIVILDTGINKSHRFFHGAENFDSISLFFNEQKKCIDFEKNETDYVGHGTAVSSIIHKYSPDTKKLVINFHNLAKQIDENLLIAILDYVYEHVKGSVINLSFGIHSCENSTSLRDICKKLNDKGFILIAAMGNDGTIAYPAAFPEVISVAVNRNITNYVEYIFFDEDDELTLAAFGINQRLPWSGNDEYNIVSGSSFSCAYITAIISELYKNGYTKLTDVKSKLREQAKQIIPFKRQIKPLCKDNMFQIKKAALFPFNKEMHSLVRFYDLLDFEIAAIYDVKYSMKIGLDTRRLMTDDSVKSFTIQNYKNINWDDFDTLILGHCEELEERTGDSSFFFDILDSALKHGKQVFSFDRIRGLSQEDKKLVQFPFISQSNMPPERFEMLYQIATPVVSFLGTGPQQGKFTLQLEIRKRLKAAGFQVGQIGTEPSALLYGMDHLYPLGYNSLRSVLIRDYDVIKYVNFLLHDLDSKGSDIILVGSQSGTIAVSPGYLRSYSLLQSTFLKATWPDIAVICIGYDDDENYIKRSINYIESATNCKVIATAFLPFSNSKNAANIAGHYNKSRLDNTLISKKQAELKTLTGLSSFCIDHSDDLDQLTNLIVDYFS